MGTDAINLGDVFRDESKETLRRCSQLLKSLRDSPDTGQILAQLLILADNLVEPSIAAAALAFHEIALPFRTTLQKISRGECALSQDSIGLMNEACACMRLLLSLNPMPDPSAVDNSELIREFEKLWNDGRTGAKNTAAKSSNLAVIDILAHDLKSPLALIRASVDILLQQKSNPDGELIHNGLQRILRQADKGLLLIRDLLGQRKAFSGDGALVRQRLNALELLRASIEGQQDAAREKGVKLLCEASDVLELLANTTFLRQILDNLLGNAIQYSRKNGKVLVKCSPSQLNGPGGSRKALLFEVSDSGRGIPEDQLALIFLEGVQSSNGGSGHGLGLAICKKLCELHGGTIWARSRIGKGTTIAFVLPQS